MSTVLNATTSATTGNNLSAEMKIYYEKRLLQNAEPYLVYNQFGDKYPIPKNNGKTIQMRKYTALPTLTTAISEGVTPDGQALDVTALTATIDQYGGWIQMTDLLDLTAIDNNLVEATKLLGAQAGRTLDALTRDEVCGGTNKLLAPKISSTGVATWVTDRANMDATSKLSVDLIFRAAAMLEAQNADTINGSYVAIIHPYAAYDLMASEQWLDVHKYATPDNIYKGEIGKLGNVRFVTSTQAKIWKDSTCPSDGSSGRLGVFATMVLGAHAYGVTEVEGGGLQTITKQLGHGEDPLDQRSSTGWKATHVAKRLQEPFMVRIESVSEFSKQVAAN